MNRYPDRIFSWIKLSICTATIFAVLAVKASPSFWEVTSKNSEAGPVALLVYDAKHRDEPTNKGPRDFYDVIKSLLFRILTPMGPVEVIFQQITTESHSQHLAGYQLEMFVKSRELFDQAQDHQECEKRDIPKSLTEMLNLFLDDQNTRKPLKIDARVYWDQHRSLQKFGFRWMGKTSRVVLLTREPCYEYGRTFCSEKDSYHPLVSLNKTIPVPASVFDWRKTGKPSEGSYLITDIDITVSHNRDGFEIEASTELYSNKLVFKPVAPAPDKKTDEALDKGDPVIDPLRSWGTDLFQVLNIEDDSELLNLLPVLQVLPVPLIFESGPAQYLPSSSPQLLSHLSNGGPTSAPARKPRYEGLLQRPQSRPLLQRFPMVPMDMSMSGQPRPPVVNCEPVFLYSDVMEGGNAVAPVVQVMQPQPVYFNEAAGYTPLYYPPEGYSQSSLWQPFPPEIGYKKQ